MSNFVLVTNHFLCCSSDWKVSRHWNAQWSTRKYSVQCIRKQRDKNKIKTRHLSMQHWYIQDVNRMYTVGIYV